MTAAGTITTPRAEPGGHRGRRRDPWPILRGIYVAVFYLFLFAPLVVVAVFAFNASPFPAPPWRGFTLDWFLAPPTGGAFGKPGVLRDAPLLAGIGNSLEVALPVSSSAGEESLMLPSTASGITRASVELLRQGVDVHLTGGLLAEKSEAGAASRWLAYGRGNEPLTFRWKRKLEDHRQTLPLRARGSVTQLTGLGEDADRSFCARATGEAGVETSGAGDEARSDSPGDD